MTLKLRDLLTEGKLFIVRTQEYDGKMNNSKGLYHFGSEAKAKKWLEKKV